MRQYLNLLELVLRKGKRKDDRTGTGTYSVFGAQARYDLREGFPLLTTKKVPAASMVHELLWMLRGQTNVRYLHERGVHLWDKWADATGDLGRVYGAQWRDWRTADGRSLDQIKGVVEQLKKNPDSRRHIVTAWNPGEIDNMAIPSCCSLFQLYVHDGELSCQLYQRSADLFLGVPFNLGAYALLTEMMAQVCDLRAGEFVHTFGDLHLYANHMNQARLQVQREPRALPTLKLNPTRKELSDFVFEDVTLTGYNPHPHIQADVSV